MLDASTSIASGGAINLYTLTAGSHTIAIKATDGAGNLATTTVTIQVHATIGGLVNAVNYGAGKGYVASSLQSQLLSTLQSAQNALSAGNNAAAKSYLSTFVSQVQNAGSTKLAPSFGTLLLSWANDLIGRL